MSAVFKYNHTNTSILLKHTFDLNRKLMVFTPHRAVDETSCLELKMKRKKERNNTSSTFLFNHMIAQVLLRDNGSQRMRTVTELHSVNKNVRWLRVTMCCWCYNNHNYSDAQSSCDMQHFHVSKWIIFLVYWETNIILVSKRNK